MKIVFNTSVCSTVVRAKTKHIGECERENVGSPALTVSDTSQSARQSKTKQFGFGSSDLAP